MSSLVFHETPTTLDALNVAKVLSGVIILFAAGRYGWTPRATIYASLHLSYIAWFLLEQYLYPSFWTRFPKEATLSDDWIPVPLLIGAFYTLPAYNVFCRKDRVTEISAPMTMLCVMMFTLGSLINATADVHMHAIKEASAPQKALVTTGLHRLSQNPNWFGDYMRYGSICLTSGKVSSFAVLALVMAINYLSMIDPSQKGGMREKYGAAYDEWVDQVPNVVVPSFGQNTEIMCGLVATWSVSYIIGYASKTNKKVKCV